MRQASTGTNTHSHNPAQTTMVHIPRHPPFSMAQVLTIAEITSAMENAGFSAEAVAQAAKGALELAAPTLGSSASVLRRSKSMARHEGIAERVQRVATELQELGL